MDPPAQGNLQSEIYNLELIFLIPAPLSQEETGENQ
jgi:hypothetical protein